MLRLLIWVFPLVIISFLFATIIVVFSVAHLFNDRFEKIAFDQSKATIFLFNEYMNQSQSEDDWQQRFEKVQNIYHAYSKVISFYDLPNLSEEKKHQLLTQHYVVTIGSSLFSIDPMIYIYNPKYDKLIYIDVDEYYARNENFSTMEMIVSFAIFAIGLFFISLWLIFHWNELKKLIHATVQISNGDFAARAKLSKLSSVKIMAEKINQMASYIERLITGQRELIHSVSHELRTPISRLSFGLELLKKTSQDYNQANITLKRIEDLEMDVQELSNLVSELLQLAKMGQQYQVKFQPVILNKLLQKSVNTLVYPEQQKQIVKQLANDLDISTYCGDQHLLERAINNILCNADKYALNKILVSSLVVNSQNYQIIIEDDGPGIPEEEWLRIFEPFYRLENIWDKKVNGYGLGLSIAQKIIQVHGGSISVMKSKLGGAKFVINL